MKSLRRVQTATQHDDEILDLESSGVYAVEHPIRAGSVEIWAEASLIHLDEPHPSPRCHSSQREILRSTFVDL